MTRGRWALLALVLATLGSGVRGVPRAKRNPDPPTVSEHVEWHRTGRDGQRPTVQLVGVVQEDGSLTWRARKMPRRSRGQEPFHVRIVRPSARGIAYYAWKAGKIDAFQDVDGKLMVQKAQRTPFWRRLI